MISWMQFEVLTIFFDRVHEHAIRLFNNRNLCWNHILVLGQIMCRAKTFNAAKFVGFGMSIKFFSSRLQWHQIRLD